MTTTRYQASRQRWKLVKAGVMIFFGLMVLLMFRSCERENLWKWRVHRKVKPEELRGWYAQVRSNPSRQSSGMAWETLNHAPAALTNLEPVKNVAPMPDYLWVCYGKVRHQWGLAIGETNSPPPSELKNASVETWAPGIYYWRE